MRLRGNTVKRIMGTVWFLVKNYLGVHTVSISERLKEERELTGFNQTKFGEIGGVTKKTQMLYESGERSPDAVYLRGVAQIGVDVQYVLTGHRSLNLGELMLTEEFVAETARERGKSLGGLPLAPQVPVVRKAHKFLSQLIVLVATGQMQEEDIDVLAGIAARLAGPEPEVVPPPLPRARPVVPERPPMPRNAQVYNHGEKPAAAVPSKTKKERK